MAENEKVKHWSDSNAYKCSWCRKPIRLKAFQVGRKPRNLYSPLFENKNLQTCIGISLHPFIEHDFGRAPQNWPQKNVIGLNFSDQILLPENSMWNRIMTCGTSVPKIHSTSTAPPSGGQTAQLAGHDFISGFHQPRHVSILGMTFKHCRLFFQLWTFVVI